MLKPSENGNYKPCGSQQHDHILENFYYNIQGKRIDILFYLQSVSSLNIQDWKEENKQKQSTNHTHNRSVDTFSAVVWISVTLVCTIGSNPINK